MSLEESILKVHPHSAHQSLCSHREEKVVLEVSPDGPVPDPGRVAASCPWHVPVLIEPHQVEDGQDPGPA